MKFREIQEACWTGYQQQGMKKKGDRMVPNCVPVEEVKIGPEITGKDLLFKAAAMAMRDASHEGISLDYEQAIKQASKIYGIPYTPSELPKLLAQRAEIDRQLDLLKQGKQVAKARRREKLAPTPAGAEEYWRTHALPTDRIKPATKTLEETEAQLAEDLKKWFKEKWVRFGPDGKIRGDCARGSSKEGKPKCLPQAKAHALGKKGRASAAAKKRREDPNPERRGPARNVATKVREVKDINAVRDLIKQSGASNAFQQADNKRQQAEALLDQLKDLQSKRQQLAMKRIKPTQEYYQELDRIVTAIHDLGYEAEGPTNGQYTLRAKFKEQHDWDDADEFGMPGSEFFPEKQPRGHYKVYYMTATDHKLMGRYATRDEAEQRVRELKANYPDNQFIVFASQRGMDEAQTDYQKRRQRERDVDAGRPVKPLPKNPKTDYQKRREKERQELDEKCWPGYEKKGMKTMFGKRYPNCVKKESIDEALAALDSDAVRRIQHMLNVKFDANLDVDGVMGPITVATVKKFLPVMKKSSAPDPARTTAVQGKEEKLAEKQDACYRKVKSRYKVWPSAYASGALVQCRKKGAANWGNKSKK